MRLSVTILFASLVALGCNHKDDGTTKAETNSPVTAGEADGPTPVSKPTAGAGTPTAPRADEESSMTSPTTRHVPDGAAEAVFAGGCFWCVEAVFEELDGVYDAVSGYAGGEAANADYRKVASGSTKHAEVVKIYYNADKITFETLLQVHFVTHDPTTLNRQGADVGPQYRSAIFYASDAEKAAAEKVIAEITASSALANPIVTTLEPLDAFYEAEAYHQNYVCENPKQGYVRGVALPKVKKVREKFEHLLKDDSPIPVTL